LNCSSGARERSTFVYAPALRSLLDFDDPVSSDGITELQALFDYNVSELFDGKNFVQSSAEPGPSE
jgi:hypothetical protein